jgi:ATP phosphoribosyltransferase
VNTKDNSNDLINAIDKLYEGQKNEYSVGNVENSRNPVSELITPEWHYSDSIKLFDSTQISWNTLGESSLIQTIADSLDKAGIPDSIV